MKETSEKLLSIDRWIEAVPQEIIKIISEVLQVREKTVINCTGILCAGLASDPNIFSLSYLLWIFLGLGFVAEKYEKLKIMKIDWEFAYPIEVISLISWGRLTSIALLPFLFHSPHDFKGWLIFIFWLYTIFNMHKNDGKRIREWAKWKLDELKQTLQSPESVVQ